MSENMKVGIYFAACFIGGLFRVWRKFGLGGFKTPKLIVDAAFSSGSGIVFPYIVSAVAPTVLMDKTPILVWAMLLATMTYWTNHFFVTMLKRAFGYTSAPGEDDEVIPPAVVPVIPPAPGGSTGDGPPPAPNTGG